MHNLECYGLTFIGRRNTNQDNFIVEKISEDTVFLAIADGMGGGPGGEIASSIVIEQAVAIVEEYSFNLNSGNLKEVLQKICSKSQIKIKKRIAEDKSLNGMGSTLTYMLIHKNRYVWANIGDSRIYKLDKDNIQQITKDHSYIQDYKDEHGKEVSKELEQKYSHYISKSINGSEDSADIFPIDKDYFELEKGTVFLLCSDGLILNNGDFKEDKFHKIIKGTFNLTEAAEQLISTAHHMGSTDNITVVLCEFGELIRGELIDKIPYPLLKELDTKKTHKEQIKKKGINTVKLLALFVTVLLVTLIAIYKYPGIMNEEKSRAMNNSTQNDYTNAQKTKKEVIPDNTVTQTTNQRINSLTQPSFDGFDKTSRTKFKLSDDQEEQFVWIPFRDNHLIKYKIVWNNNRSDSGTIMKSSLKIQLQELGIKQPGNYEVKIFAVLEDSTEIPGKNKLNLNIIK